MVRPTIRGEPGQLEAVVAGRLALRLSGHRMIRRKTLGEVASEIGCTKSLLSKFENGRTLPSLGTLMRLADVYGTTAGALVDP